MRKRTKKQEPKPKQKLWPLIAILAVGLLVCGIGAMFEDTEPAQTPEQPSLVETVEDAEEKSPEEATAQTPEPDAPVEETLEDAAPEDAPAHEDDAAPDVGESTAPEAEETDETPPEATPDAAPELDTAADPEPDIAPESATAPGSAAEPESEPEPEPEPEPDAAAQTPTQSTAAMVWIPTNGGTKYHRRASCSSMIDPEQVTQEEAERRGFTACKRCYG